MGYEFPLLLSLISKVMRSFHPFTRFPWRIWFSWTSWNSGLSLSVQLPQLLLQDSFIDNCSHCSFLDQHRIFSAVPFLTNIRKKCYYLKLQTDIIICLFSWSLSVPLALCIPEYSWDMTSPSPRPILKLLWHFYCAHLILLTLQ